MELSDLAKRMIFTILIIALICILLSIIYYRSLDFLPFMYGVFLGSTVSITKVFLLEHAVDKALAMEQTRAGIYVSIQHVFRLVISGVALFLGAVVPQISLWGVVAGILAFQLAVYNIKFT
jgi:hypothetical protein